MKFGANAFIWSERFDRSHIPLLDRLRAAGFDGIELPLIDPDQTRDTAVREALHRSQMEPTFCTVLPPGLSPISDDSGVRDRTVQHYRRCIETAREMGGSLIAGPLYSPVGYLPGRRRTEEEWKRAVGCFQQLCPALDEHGVTLAIEPLNRYETYFLNTAADAARLCSEVGHDRVGILFDTYHANIEEKHVPEAIVTAGPYLRHFHSCENDRGVPGTGHIDWPGVFESLRAVHYDGWLTIESFGFSLGMLSAAASVWRDLAPTAETIAFDGLKFLREMTAR